MFILINVMHNSWSKCLKSGWDCICLVGFLLGHSSQHGSFSIDMTKHNKLRLLVFNNQIIVPKAVC